MSGRQSYDVAIIGGGLAGLSLALQVKQAAGDLDVLVADRSPHPVPEAAHKVGESSVEMASHYLGSVLGLEPELKREVPKLGLRFFFAHEDNADIGKRLELGLSNFLPFKSFQIDRGNFENELGRRCRELGVDFLDACQVANVQVGNGAGRHQLTLKQDGKRSLMSCDWLVDASGRPGTLKHKLGLKAPSGHHASAVWFRIDHPIDVDAWCAKPSWSKRVDESRRLSTVHLLGEGYWAWLIPLIHGRTSVGVVIDDRSHDVTEMRTFELAKQWLLCHEPQLAEAVTAHEGALMDFRVLKDFSYSSKQVFSEDRWCLTGDAGLFLDPLYSPGSDFIGLSNTFITDLIVRSHRDEDIRKLASFYDNTYRRFFRIFLTNYRQQYQILGNARVMGVKILWDFSVYWGCVAHLFCNGKFTDIGFMRRANAALSTYSALTVRMQSFFRDWARLDREPVPEGFLDYASVAFLESLNAELLERPDDEGVLLGLERHLVLAQEMEQEILAVAARRVSSFSSPGRVESNHLAPVFEAFGLT